MEVKRPQAGQRSFTTSLLKSPAPPLPFPVVFLLEPILAVSPAEKANNVESPLFFSLKREDIRLRRKFFA
jgi:hypothetical protein